jgi:hypothetical protein
VASGLVREPASWNRPAAIIRPDPGTKDRYDRGYADYRRLHLATRDIARRLAALREEGAEHIPGQ